MIYASIPIALSINDCYRNARRYHRYACITFDNEMESFTGGSFAKTPTESGLSMETEGGLSGYGVFVFPKHSLLTQVFNRFIRSIIAAGLGLHWNYMTHIDHSEEARRKVIEEGTKNNKTVAYSGRVVSLNLHHMQGAIKVGVAGGVISLATFLVEIGLLSLKRMFGAFVKN